MSENISSKMLYSFYTASKSVTETIRPTAFSTDVFLPTQCNFGTSYSQAFEPKLFRLLRIHMEQRQLSAFHGSRTGRQQGLSIVTWWEMRTWNKVAPISLAPELTDLTRTGYVIIQYVCMYVCMYVCLISLLFRVIIFRPQIGICV
jgi:hypothetical protein